MRNWVRSSIHQSRFQRLIRRLWKQRSMRRIMMMSLRIHHGRGGKAKRIKNTRKAMVKWWPLSCFWWVCWSWLRSFWSQEKLLVWSEDLKQKTNSRFRPRKQRMTKWSLFRIFAEKQRKRLRRSLRIWSWESSLWVRKLLTWQKERFLLRIFRREARLSNIQLLSIISARELSRSPFRMWMDRQA